MHHNKQVGHEHASTAKEEADILQTVATQYLYIVSDRKGFFESMPRLALYAPTPSGDPRIRRRCGVK